MDGFCQLALAAPLHPVKSGLDRLAELTLASTAVCEKCSRGLPSANFGVSWYSTLDIICCGFGRYHPIASNDTREGRAQEDRRINIVIQDSDSVAKVQFRTRPSAIRLTERNPNASRFSAVPGNVIAIREQ
jgi:hypothetical protein